MAVKKRCMFCHKHTRADGTCQTEGCPLYVPEEKAKDDKADTNEEKAEEEPASDGDKQEETK